MKPMLLVVLFGLCGCSKNSRMVPVTVNAECLRCAVEYTAEGATHRDTLLWRLVRLNGDVFDTLPTTGKWNLVLEEGVPVSVKAQRLDTYLDSGLVTVWINDGVDHRVDKYFPDSIASLNHTIAEQ